MTELAKTANPQTDDTVDRLLDDFDHQSADFAHHWAEVYGKARANQCPVIHSDEYGGFDAILGYDDVVAAFRDWKTFASERLLDEDGIEMEGGVGIPAHVFRIGFLEMDPPQSLNLRRLCNPWFNRNTIEAARPRLGEIMHWAFDNVAEKGQCDVVTELVTPFQCVSIMDLLGIPLEKWPRYKEVVDQEVAQEESSLEGMQWLLADIFDEIERQTTEGGHGLLAVLASSELEGERLDPELVTELILMFLLGGMDTTIATVGLAVRHLHDTPEDRARLQESPDLIESFVEEVLRFYTPATGMGRTIRTPTTFAGQGYERGDRVYLAIASANRDERAFDRADEFVIDRSPNPHMSFGTGTHHCIGSEFARSNTQLFLTMLLSRMPDFEVDVAAAHMVTSIPHARSYLTLPISYGPGRSFGSGDHAWPEFKTDPIRPV